MIYLASPYSHDSEPIREERFSLAVLAAGSIALQGYVIYSPIVHFHPIVRAKKLPFSMDFWITQALGMLRLASNFYMLQIPGADTSSGMKIERQFADQHGIPAFSMIPDGDAAYLLKLA